MARRRQAAADDARDKGAGEGDRGGGHGEPEGQAERLQVGELCVEAQELVVDGEAGERVQTPLPAGHELVEKGEQAKGAGQPG